MKNIQIGKTGMCVPQNAFGCLPIQRNDTDTAVKLLRRAYEGGMRFFDTARAYSDSETKVGIAFEGMRDKVYIATKTQAKTADELEKQLQQSLTELKTDYIDLYQLHCTPQCYKPDDGTGLYEALLKAKEDGRVRHIGITTHKIGVAQEAVKSGLYETLQYPFSYLASEAEIQLVKDCTAAGMGFIAMKGLAGGLINNSRAAMAYMLQYDGCLPIWGIQRENELEEWLSYMDNEPKMDDELRAYIENEQKELSGEFCRGCGYCMPCPQGIQINNCARMSLMLRRAPSKAWLNDYWQEEMKKTETCLNCGKCASKCPYSLNTPELLRKNLEDYKNVLEGKTKV